MVATALSFTACDEIEDIIDDLVGDGDKIVYVGAMDVSASGVTAYSDDATEFTLEKDGDSVTILMSSMKFSEYMPVTLDITISDIPATDSTFSTSSVIPTVSGIPMEDYTITNVSGVYDVNTLTMTFECYGCTVTYVGVAE